MNKQNLLSKILDFIFPPNEDALRVRSITIDHIRSLLTLDVHIEEHVLSPYTHPDIRALIHEAKFRRNTHAHLLLNTLFQEYVERYKIHTDLIIPIPLSKARMRNRGYNQVTAILSAQKLRSEIPVVTDLLIRTRDTTPQTKLRRAERLTNIQGAFGVAHGERITGKKILILDDVSTTGATLQTAKAALLPYKPAAITLVALAH